MGLEYAIIGGSLEVDKNVFTKEMLCQGSRIRKLLNANDAAGKINIIKNEAAQIYTIHFNHSGEVKLDDNYATLLKSLQEDYPGKIRGKVTIRVNTEYNTFFTAHTIE